MKRLIVVVAFVAMLVSCSGKYGAGVPRKYDTLLDEAFAKTENSARLREALKDMPRSEREGMAYLISYMTAGDLDTIDVALLKENVEYAYKVRREFEWTKELPVDIFLNEVLPYAVVDEVRDEWRKMYYDTFAPKVKDCKTLHEAIKAVNMGINEVVGVEYNTLREKTNQSPRESMRQHMASCTGLSIILVDAFRSVGIPARFAGTAAWHDDRGNHSWVEVWVEGQWYFTEFYPRELDDSWFLADAGKGTAGDHTYGVYATSYSPTGDWFEMVWSPDSKDIHGIDVTDRYAAVYKAREDKWEQSGDYVSVGFMMLKKPTNNPQSGDRVAANVDVFRGADQMGGGRTSGQTHDMNDVLTFTLEKNAEYTFKYADSKDKPREIMVHIGEEPTIVRGYME